MLANPTFSASRLRQRPILISLGLFSIASLLVFWQISSSPTAKNLRALSPTWYLYPPGRAPASRTMEVLSQLYEDERRALLMNFNEATTELTVKTALGALNPDFDAYMTRLERFVDTYFNGSAYHPGLSRVLHRMNTAQWPLTGPRAFEKRIISFDKDPQHVPDEFAYWGKRLSGAGWGIHVADDRGMEALFEDCLVVQGDKDGRGSESGADLWRELWGGLGRPVLKSDVLRYLMMLTQGGLYTDSDTSVLSDPNLWGIHATDMTPRGLLAIQRAMRHLDPTSPSALVLNQPDVEVSSLDSVIPIIRRDMEDEADEEDDSAGGDAATTDAANVQNDEIHPPSAAPAPPWLEMDDPSTVPEERPDLAAASIMDVRKGINNPHVSVVLAVEYDITHPRQDERFGYTRNLQIVQWTFMAKPYHPIFLDVLETATTRLSSLKAEGKSQNNWQSILDGTGPGPFTDAVLRYLLNQYGFSPEQLKGMEHGALVGDVLVIQACVVSAHPSILPLHAFGSYLGGEEDWNAHDPSTRCTAHGFRGRWKGGMDFTKRNRGPLRQVTTG